MKKQLLLPIGILALSCLAACNNGTTTTTTTTADSSVNAMPASGSSTTTSRKVTVVENESYTDLKTGKSFKIRKDPASGHYVSESGEPLEYYLSPATHDTFYGATGRWVNNALIYNPDHSYSIDEDRWNQMNAETTSTMQGESSSTSATEDTDTPASSTGGTTMHSGDKIKVNDHEYKAKSADGSKVKINENETKIKNKDVKVKANDHEVKIKQR